LHHPFNDPSPAHSLPLFFSFINSQTHIAYVLISLQQCSCLVHPSLPHPSTPTPLPAIPLPPSRPCFNHLSPTHGYTHFRQ
jgi:hypothetical protein